MDLFRSLARKGQRDTRTTIPEKALLQYAACPWSVVVVVVVVRDAAKKDARRAHNGRARRNGEFDSIMRRSVCAARTGFPSRNIGRVRLYVATPR